MHHARSGGHGVESRLAAGSNDRKQAGLELLLPSMPSPVQPVKQVGRMNKYGLMSTCCSAQSAIHPLPLFFTVPIPRLPLTPPSCSSIV